MSRTLPKNHEYWQNWGGEGIYDPDMADGACVISGGYGSFVDGGYMHSSHFGDTICFSLSHYISESLADLEAQSQLNPSDDSHRANLIAAEQALDDLLGEFLEQGYRTGMKERLQEIVNNARTQLEIDEIFVLPDDLAALLSSTHSPFIDYDAYESEEEADANAPAFDWNNPEHRAALKQHLWNISC